MASRVIIDEDGCKGCGLCEVACPKNILVRPADKINARGLHPAAVTDMALCIGCGFCALMCPDMVIAVEKD